ncbi:MAG TPA: hypothetical protein ENO03_08065 [Candidatus Aminicenantes bacterium]|nr:hypothetical protein [Candidatus Aminicenantes bacterium]
MSEKPHIQISAETVVKSGAPSLMRVEVEKTRRAGRIGKTSGLFRVPEVIDYDEARGVAVFERITGIQPLRLVLCRGELDSILVGRIGAALAAVHRELTLPSEMIVPLPPEFVAGGGVSFFMAIRASTTCIRIRAKRRWLLWTGR